MHTEMPLVRPRAIKILWHQVEMDSVTSIVAPGTCSQRKGDAGHSIERTEKINKDALLALLRHDGVDSETKAKLQRMHRGLRNGNSFTVTYSKANKLGLGRFYADRGLGLQMLPWDVRNALCSQLVHDLDMINAHPIILLHLARKHGWVCSFLKRLCEDREEILRSIAEAYDVDRAESKVAILKLLYLGGLPVDHRFACLEAQLAQTLSGPGTADTLVFMEGLKAELLSLSANMVAAYPAEAKEAARQRKAKNKVNGHPNATAVSLVVTEVESQMLVALERELVEHKRVVTTLIYDGLHVKKLEGENELPGELLRKCEAAIHSSTGLKVQLAQKPMHTTFELDLELDVSKDEFDHCQAKLIKYALKHGLVRMMDSIYQPVPGSICAFQLLPDSHDYRDFINLVLCEDPDYHSKPEMQDKLYKWLLQFQHKSFPLVSSPDRALLSFRNGVYVLPEDRFITAGSEEAAKLTASGRIARHHIDADMTEDISTPQFDQLIRHQLEPEAEIWLLAMLGRLQYRVAEKDNWQVMPYIFGLANTGKGTAMRIYSKSFRPGAVAILSANTETTFGLEKLANPFTEAIMCQDMPSDKSAEIVLAQSVWQSVISGDDVSIPRKNRSPLNMVIPSHMMMAGNNYIGYKDTNNNVTRRVFGFRYQNHLPASQQDGKLEENIVQQELPALIRKCNQAYLKLARQHGHQGIWHVVPEYFKLIKKEAAGLVNPLVEFLTAPEPPSDENVVRHYALFEEGTETRQVDLVAALKIHMRLEHPGVRFGTRWSGDEVGPLFDAGYEKRKKMICKACKQEHKRGCCPRYNSLNRTSEVVWINLTLVPVEPNSQQLHEF